MVKTNACVCPSRCWCGICRGELVCWVLSQSPANWQILSRAKPKIFPQEKFSDLETTVVHRLLLRSLPNKFAPERGLICSLLVELLLGVSMLFMSSNVFWIGPSIQNRQHCIETKRLRYVSIVQGTLRGQVAFLLVPTNLQFVCSKNTRYQTNNTPTHKPATNPTTIPNANKKNTTEKKSNKSKKNKQKSNKPTNPPSKPKAGGPQGPGGARGAAHAAVPLGGGGERWGVR